MIRVRDIGAVVLEILLSVAVTVDERRFASVSYAIAVFIGLIVVRMIGAVVACIASAVAVTVFLTRVRDIGAVVKRYFYTVAIAVYCCGFASITDPVSIRIFLIFVCYIRAVIAFITETVFVRIVLAVTGNKRTFVFAVHDPVTVGIDIWNTASADAGLCLVEIVGAEVFDIAVRLFFVFVRFGVLFRFWFWFLVGNFRAAVVYDSIGKFLFIRFFLNTAVIRNNGFFIGRTFAS